MQTPPATIRSISPSHTKHKHKYAQKTGFLHIALRATFFVCLRSISQRHAVDTGRIHDALRVHTYTIGYYTSIYVYVQKIHIDLHLQYGSLFTAIRARINAPFSIR